MSDEISYDDFLKVDIRAGTVISAEDLPKARKPAYVLMIDFGPDIGVKKSSAQVTKHYSKDELIGRQVAAVVNFPPRQIGSIKSQVLTIGFADDAEDVVLIGLDKTVPNGSRMF